MAERAIKAEVRLDEYCKKLDQITDTLADFQKDTRNRFDNLSTRITALEAKLETAEEERRSVLNIRLSLIGLTVTTVLSVIGLFLR